MRYYGCKDKIIPLLEKGVLKTELNGGSKFVDLFAGTNSVAKHFKSKGYTVITNDLLDFSYTLAKTYIELNNEPKFLKLKKELIDNTSCENYSDYVVGYLNNLKPKKGFIFKNFGDKGLEKRKYFSEKNAKKIDSIRGQIEKWKDKDLITELEYHYLLTSLIEAVNLVSNVAGTYGAFLKKMDKRAEKDMILVPPKIIKSKKKNKAYKMDANLLIRKIKADILYLDPPYNIRQYSANYFLLDVITVGWFGKKKPVPKGKTGLVNFPEKISKYSSKSLVKDTFEDLIANSKSKYILFSYSNEGLLKDRYIKSVLNNVGNVKVLKKTHKRYKSVNQNETDPRNTQEFLYFVETPQAQKRANKLDGSSWLQNSISVWRRESKDFFEKNLNHPAIFPRRLADRIIETFTNGSKSKVLDPFAGSGGTLIAGLDKKMDVYGFDINKEYKKLFEERLKDYEIKKTKKVNYFIDDAINLGKKIKPNTIDICLTSPPYWDILNARRSADLKNNNNYTNKKNDLGNMSSYDMFLVSLKNVMAEVYKVQKSNGYCITVLMDLRKREKFYPFHCDVISFMKDLGYKFEDLIIWDREREYNNCKPLGYPYKFIVNKVHEYILFFRK